MTTRYDAVAVRRYKDRDGNEKSQFTTIGTAWPMRDKDGFTVRLNAVPAPTDARHEPYEHKTAHFRNRAEEAEAEVKRLREALQNVMGCYDTPLSRRRFPPDVFMTEAIITARQALASTGGEHNGN